MSTDVVRSVGIGDRFTLWTARGVYLFFAIGLVATGSRACGQKSKGQEKPADTPAALIAALASRNLPPRLVKSVPGPFPLYPENYDWQEEQRVHAAFRALWGDDSQELLRLLVEHSEDPQYSFVWIYDDADAAIINTVGRLCKFIARENLTWPLMNCTPGTMSKNASVDLQHLHDLSDLKAWYRTRADKPLYELQIEICRSGLKKIQDKKYFEKEERDQVIERLEYKILWLTTNQKPLIPDHYHHEAFDLVGADKAKRYRERFLRDAKAGHDRRADEGE